MTTARVVAKVDQLMEQASEALARTDYFECERLAADALELAHQAADYGRMARIVLPLQEARRNKRLAAVDSGKLIILTERVPPRSEIETACYLVEPPLVGADGRELRERADEEGVPVFVIVREPRTQLGKWPVVMIGPVTVRARIDPPAHPDGPDLAWFEHAGELLGEEVLDQIDPDAPAPARVDQLSDALATVVQHERLHQALEAACREASAAVASGDAEPTRRRTGTRKRGRPARRPDPDEED